MIKKILIHILFFSLTGLLLNTVSTKAVSKPITEQWLACNIFSKEANVTIEIKRAHKYLAEYHQRLILKSKNHPPIIHSLQTTSGGEYFSNIYKSPKNHLLKVENKWSEIILNLDNLKVVDTSTIKNTDWQYMGRCEKQDGFRFIPTKDSKEKAIPTFTGG